jgi:hypothetical protein
VDRYTDPVVLIAALVAVAAGITIVCLLARPAGWAAALFLGTVVIVPGVLAPDPVLPVAVAVAAWFARRWIAQGTVQPQAFARFGLQLGCIVAGYAIYSLTRMRVEPGSREAISNARDLIDFERSLSAFFEGSLQDLLARGLLTDIFNALYLYAYWPLPIVALFVLYLRDRTGFRILRDSLAISAVLALITFAVFPVAPPRLMPGLGIFDTIDPVGQARVVSNQFAAVPSLHVGWPALVGLLMYARGSGWIRGLAPVPAAVMFITIIVTGNHYWLDAVVGIAFALTPAIYMLAINHELSDRISRDRPIRV